MKIALVGVAGVVIGGILGGATSYFVTAADHEADARGRKEQVFIELFRKVVAARSEGKGPSKVETLKEIVILKILIDELPEIVKGDAGQMQSSLDKALNLLDEPSSKSCAPCRGSGMKNRNRCQACAGSGKVANTGEELQEARRIVEQTINLMPKLLP